MLQAKVDYAEDLIVSETQDDRLTTEKQTCSMKHRTDRYDMAPKVKRYHPGNGDRERDRADSRHRKKTKLNVR